MPTSAQMGFSPDDSSGAARPGQTDPRDRKYGPIILNALRDGFRMKYLEDFMAEVMRESQLKKSDLSSDEIESWAHDVLGEGLSADQPLTPRHLNALLDRILIEGHESATLKKGRLLSRASNQEEQAELQEHLTLSEKARLAKGPTQVDFRRMLDKHPESLGAKIMSRPPRATARDLYQMHLLNKSEVDHEIRKLARVQVDGKRMQRDGGAPPLTGPIRFRDRLSRGAPTHAEGKRIRGCSTLSTDCGLSATAHRTRGTIDCWLREDIRFHRDHPFTLNARGRKHACSCQFRVWAERHKRSDA